MNSILTLVSQAQSGSLASTALPWPSLRRRPRRRALVRMPGRPAAAAL